MLHNLCNKNNCHAPNIIEDWYCDGGQVELVYTTGNDNQPSTPSQSDELRHGQAAIQCLVRSLWSSRRQR